MVLSAVATQAHFTPSLRGNGFSAVVNRVCTCTGFPSYARQLHNTASAPTRRGSHPLSGLGGTVGVTMANVSQGQIHYQLTRLQDLRQPERTPLVLIPGTAQTILSWVGHAQHFSRYTNVLQYETRGQVFFTFVPSYVCDFTIKCIAPFLPSGGAERARKTWEVERK
jgi:hypothetical protein